MVNFWDCEPCKVIAANRGDAKQYYATFDMSAPDPLAVLCAEHHVAFRPILSDLLRDFPKSAGAQQVTISIFTRQFNGDYYSLAVYDRGWRLLASGRTVADTVASLTERQGNE